MKRYGTFVNVFNLYRYRRVPLPILTKKIKNLEMNVTLEFKNQVKTLKKGELLHCENFDLGEGVSAITIGDARIDSGILTGNESDFNNYAGAAESTLNDPLQKLKMDGLPNTKKISSASECIGVMDRLLAGLYHHLNGEMIVPCIFSCLFLDSIQKPTFENFKSILFKTLLHSRRVILDARLFMEEDFMAEIAGFSLYSRGCEYDLENDFVDCCGEPGTLLKKALESRFKVLEVFGVILGSELTASSCEILSGYLTQLIQTCDLGQDMTSSL